MKKWVWLIILIAVCALPLLTTGCGTSANVVGVAAGTCPICGATMPSLLDDGRLKCKSCGYIWKP